MKKDSKLKTIWYNDELESNFYVIDFGNREILVKVHNLLENDELMSLFEILKLDDKELHLSPKALDYYLPLFNTILESEEQNTEDDDPIKAKLTTHQSHHIDIHMIKNVSEVPNKLDLIKKCIFALNKFIIRTFFPSWDVCETLGIFPAQDNYLEIGQIIYIGPGLYLFSPFMVPSLTIPTSAANLGYAAQLIQTLLCLRHNIIKKNARVWRIERKVQQLIMNQTNKYITEAMSDEEEL
ncbi:hypothetical protein RhiirA5_418815 [Rhizophagus irregularis]|uniref:Uncharacterized protein n=1 Tax=Rhizophagus irregularis TaxID=588596 RepID=A0A2N0PJL8_9GLOM|nr:hypothetical protein RhiirA5_418815 [Rhizophagus irregularis]PKC67341.1 hypothetical protein RhiirA1_458547 [Rhizophagus irregularis]